MRAVVPGVAVLIAFGVGTWLWLDYDRFPDPGRLIASVDSTEIDQAIDDCIETLSERHQMEMEKSEPGPGSRVYDLAFCAGALKALDTQ